MTRPGDASPRRHLGMSWDRPIRHRYADPLDQIWLAAIARIGLRVRRDSAVFASTDGAGTLRVGHRDALDPDDCLAQMSFHELCHSLVEGPDAFERPDWGLDNTGTRDVSRERACLRLQAALAGEYGLRRLLAPTTEYRGFYDALGPDPLALAPGPSSSRAASDERAAAVLGLQRADRPPWAPHVRAALAATANVAARVAPACADADRADPAALPSLWQLAEPIPARHPLGPPHAPGEARTCGDCAWRYRGGRGVAVDRCRHHDGARVQPDWRACNRFEAALDCRTCGACCREAYHSVTVSRRDPAARRHPDLVVDRGDYLELRRSGDRCVALTVAPAPAPAPSAPVDVRDSYTGHRYACRIYADRPRSCREFERGGANCLTARRRVGLTR